MPAGATGKRLHAIERDGVRRLAREIDAIAEAACLGLDQRDRRSGQHRKMLRVLGERHAARLPAQGAVGIQRDRVARPRRRDRHRAFRRLQIPRATEAIRRAAFRRAAPRRRSAPRRPSTANPSASSAPAPPCSSGTQASVSPASASARHSGAFQPASLARLISCGSARSAKMRAAVSATIELFAHGASCLLPWPNGGRERCSLGKPRPRKAAIPARSERS